MPGSSAPRSPCPQVYGQEPATLRKEKEAEKRQKGPSPAPEGEGRGAEGHSLPQACPDSGTRVWASEGGKFHQVPERRQSFATPERPAGFL